MSIWKTVVVGVDGSPGSRKALIWAAAEAADHQADLVVVNVSELPVPAPAGNPSVPDRTAAKTIGYTPDELLTEIKEVLGDDPPLVVLPSIKQGNAAKVLIEQSSDADLLVVGTRGHGGFRGLVLGSVSQHVAGYAQCCVAVIR